MIRNAVVKCRSEWFLYRVVSFEGFRTVSNIIGNAAHEHVGVKF